MPRRPFAQTRQFPTPPSIASPRVFGGGVVICRTVPEEQFDLTAETFTTEAITMPDLVSGPTFFKVNVDIAVGGAWIYPDYYEYDFQVRLNIDDELYTRPNSRKSFAFGEFPTNYHAYPSETPASNSPSSTILKWGPGAITQNYPTIINHHLNGIITLPPGPIVQIHVTNRSSGLSDYASVSGYITTYACAAETGVDTFEIVDDV